MHLFTRLLSETEGQDLIEYAVLSAFIAIAMIVALSAVALKVSKVFERLAAAL